MGDCARYYRDGVPESVWEGIYNRLDQTGRLSDAFPPLAVVTLCDFMDFYAAPGRFSWVVTFKDEIGAVARLADMDGYSAHIHFAMLPTQTRRSSGRLPAPVAIARFFVAGVLWDRDDDGGHILDTLLGITPVTNRAACKVVKSCGAVVMGEVPGLCRVSGHERNVPGMVTYFTRESVCSDWCRL
jgi:hypothetical protein